MQLSKYAKKMLETIHRETGLERFFVYGGRAIKLLLRKKTKCYDVDIITKGISPKKMKLCKKNLEKNHWDIFAPVCAYPLRFKQKALLIYAKKKRTVLEIGFLKDPTQVGVLNVDSLYIQYPEKDVQDPFGTIRGIRRKKILFARNPVHENPYLLLRLYIRNCAKYQIDLQDKKNARVLREIEKRIKKQKRTAKVALEENATLLSSVLKSIVISKNKKIFCRQIGKVRLIAKFFPCLCFGLKKAIRKETSKSFEKIRSKIVLARLLEKNMTETQIEAFEKTLSCLKIQPWNVKDAQLVKLLSTRSIK